MDRLYKEEKKDGAEVAGEIDEKDGEIISESEDDECEELVDLPPEITKLLGKGDRDRVYKSEEELERVLAEAGVGDLRVVLVKGKPKLVNPSDQHNFITSVYAFKFSFRWGRWGFCSGTHKIHLPQGKSRDPDLSYWGYPRCIKRDNGTLQPNDTGSIPDVIIQFSWQNRKQYEVDAINDMMNRGLESDHGAPSATRPTLGYLVKVRFSKKRTLAGAIKGSKTQDIEGLDIYRLPHGTTIADAQNVNNTDAELWHYTPGGPEIIIVIAPQDLGITGTMAWLCGEYRIKASELFQDMKKYHTKRQSEGLAT
jgi:hypothetical protein